MHQVANALRSFIASTIRFSVLRITSYNVCYTKLLRDDEPIFLTKNGVGDMVVMSLEHYEKQLAKIDLYQKLNIARDEIRNGAPGKDAKKLLKDLMK